MDGIGTCQQGNQHEAKGKAKKKTTTVRGDEPSSSRKKGGGPAKNIIYVPAATSSSAQPEGHLSQPNPSCDPGMQLHAQSSIWH